MTDCKEYLKLLLTRIPSIVVVHESELMNPGLLSKWFRSIPKNVSCCLQASKSGVKTSRVGFFPSTTLTFILCLSLCNEIILLRTLPFKWKIVWPCVVHIWILLSQLFQVVISWIVQVYFHEESCSASWFLHLSVLFVQGSFIFAKPMYACRSLDHFGCESQLEAPRNIYEMISLIFDKATVFWLKQ